MEQTSPPPIAALFHVVFDQKVGYTLSWRRSWPPGLDLSGVEYQALPSGLHAVKSDVVYFIHAPGQPNDANGRAEEYAGVAAFAQGEADSAHRNASFCAVGALIPLGKHGSGGRLGKGWLHAPALRELATDLATKAEGTDKRALELYWKKHSFSAPSSADGRTDSDARSRSPEERRESLLAGLESKRASSAGLWVDSSTAADHPAMYMSALLDSFGPLIFPLYRAALLRQRILLLGSAPVQRNCNVVYILSVLSSLPPSLADVLPPQPAELRTISALFSVGIPNITTLSTISAGNDGQSAGGYLATTTDDILGEKPQLYDLLVELAPGVPGSKRRWPRLRTNEGHVVKATQRDLRRYRLLRSELRRLRLARRHRYQDDEGNDDQASEEDETPLMAGSRQLLRGLPEDEEMRSGEDEVVEPQSWTAIAYNSMMWWASAGSTAVSVEAEEEQRFERGLMADLPDIQDAMLSTDDSITRLEDEQLVAAQETATVLTAYFHRLTSQTLTALSQTVADADDEAEDGGADESIEVNAEDVRAMGLDVWSENDKQFVKSAMKAYFGKETKLADSSWEVCGLRVC